MLTPRAELPDEKLISGGAKHVISPILARRNARHPQETRLPPCFLNIVVTSKD